MFEIPLLPSVPFGLSQALIVVVTALAVVTDLRHRRIPNALTFPAMALGLVVNLVTDGPVGLLRALAGIGLGVAFFALPVAYLGRGAGDLKLLAALGALGGPEFVLWCALFTGVAGAVFAIAVLLARRRFGDVVGGMALDLYTGQVPQATSNIRLPYALPIAAGAAAAMLV